MHISALSEVEDGIAAETASLYRKDIHPHPQGASSLCEWGFLPLFSINLISIKATTAFPGQLQSNLMDLRSICSRKNNVTHLTQAGECFTGSSATAQASRWKLTAASTGPLTAFLETPRSGRFEIRRGSQQGWNRGKCPKTCLSWKLVPLRGFQGSKGSPSKREIANGGHISVFERNSTHLPFRNRAYDRRNRSCKQSVVSFDILPQKIATHIVNQDVRVQQVEGRGRHRGGGTGHCLSLTLQACDRLSRPSHPRATDHRRAPFRSYREAEACAV